MFRAQIIARSEHVTEQAILRSPRTSAAERSSDRTGWGAVLALALCVSTLIASEFMPVSILTPIASDLHLTEGAAGQAISVSGLFAVLTSLSISTMTRGIDRRTLLLSLTALMLASGLLVAFAPNFAMLMAGRALLGVVIGGFWSMSAATVMRLVPERRLARLRCSMAATRSRPPSPRPLAAFSVSTSAGAARFSW
jgi:predicted MFS family arabinose efflux permease